jgi:hypothetical protein
MKHRSKLLGLAAVLAVAGLGVFVSSSIGGGAVEPASSIDITRSQGETIKGNDLKLVDTEKVPVASGSGAGASVKLAKLFYFISVETFTVQPGFADFREIRCPVKFQPVTGGVHAAAPGLAITNSSRTNPSGPTLGGAWYQEVTNVTSVPLSWRVHLTCLSAKV